MSADPMDRPPRPPEDKDEHIRQLLEVNERQAARIDALSKKADIAELTGPGPPPMLRAPVDHRRRP